MRILRYLLIVLIFSISVFAEETVTENPFSYQFRTDYAGKYIWRGHNLQDDGVLQPSFTINKDNMKLSIWGNGELSDENGNDKDISEIDIVFDYGGDINLWDLSNVSYNIGVINYNYPGTNFASTTELYAGVSINILLNPSITIFRDIDETDGTYIQLKIGHDLENVINDININLAMSLGWADGTYNKALWGTSGSDFNDFVFSAAFPIPIKDWSLMPSINYVSLMSDDINSRGDDDFVFFMFSIIKEF